MGKDNIKEDLRIRKTRAAIKDALYELTREKTYQEISVMDIAQRAMINRSTFYLHYKDKDALLDALAQEVLEDMNPIADAISEENLRNCAKTGAPFPHFIQILTYIRENPAFFQLILGSNKKGSFYLELSQEFSPKVARALQGFKPDAIARTYGPVALINALSGILRKWIKNGMGEEPEQLAALITRVSLAVMAIDHI